MKARKSRRRSRQNGVGISGARVFAGHVNVARFCAAQYIFEGKTVICRDDDGTVEEGEIQDSVCEEKREERGADDLFYMWNEQTKGFVLALKAMRRLDCCGVCLPKNRHESELLKDICYFLASDL